ncbi:two-component system, CitB family, sensor kinase/two-component system, CitB family, sensor histidine kinase CitS [Evansella caseinilytica]|uniref:histidine kinase n=1 Tax=Evansella caseinilytica TaxID=1503961 RepID=A0A1H3GB53_9BACI|nr:sensor histidine kinase [Evansella caseinilytica]SDX99734.1 two-component system, CitB family, sensor kinase/two-component system, CitB family, sensor histidine kinase CitS [Evansella caseinilytica]
MGEREAVRSRCGRREQQPEQTVRELWIDCGTIASQVFSRPFKYPLKYGDRGGGTMTLFNKKRFRLNKPPACRFTLLSKMIVLICSLIIFMLVFFGLYTNAKYSETLVEQIGMRALNVSQSVSEIPEIREAFFTENPAERIQPLAEAIRIKTGAEFIVVGNKEGIRYSHPLEERLGEPMMGDDNERALLFGESYISEATGSLGPSIRGKAPVFSNEGEIIGIVSVGFLIDDVATTIGNYVADTWYWIIICVLLGVIGATFISLHVKNSIFGLEPDEIGRLFQEREAILQSLHEAMIAVDREGSVTMLNQAAENVVRTADRKVTGKHINELIANTQLIEVLETGKTRFNQELRIDKQCFIVNYVPVYNNHKLIGAVATFHNRTEIELLAEELSKIKQYSEALRAQTHEFSNKLNTVSGLLQLEQTQEAIEFITKESKKQQEWIHFFIHRVKDAYVSAVLLGKLNRAHELGIKMTIHSDSELTTPLTENQREGLVTIIGNLLENACDAVQESNRKRQISIFFTDIGEEILFEVEDSGPGISEDDAEEVFTNGFTTKNGAHRGLGLALVRQLSEDLGGNIALETGELGGACFVLSIPKVKRLEGDRHGQHVL